MAPLDPMLEALSLGASPMFSRSVSQASARGGARSFNEPEPELDTKQVLDLFSKQGAWWLVQGSELTITGLLGFGDVCKVIAAKWKARDMAVKVLKIEDPHASDLPPWR
eukprot:2340316-Rhodomonas_salina.1